MLCFEGLQKVLKVQKARVFIHISPLGCRGDPIKKKDTGSGNLRANSMLVLEGRRN